MQETFSLIYICLLLFSFIRGTLLTLKIPRTFAFLNRGYERYASLAPENHGRKIYILIPLLREQKVLPQILEVFSRIEGEYKVILITTEKEAFESAGDCITTKELAGDLLKKLPRREKFEILHYPKSTGVMAHQLNYAVKFLEKREVGSEFYIAVYNADSIVDEDHIKMAQRMILEEKVIQQSAIFLSNFTAASKSFREAFLKGNGLLQTRWTLVHELPRLIRQLKSNRFRSCEVAHVVGHGLIISSKALRSVGGFPTQFVNEDLPLGYLLRLKGYNIAIYPKLELAESPRSVGAVFRQYRTWFYGAFHSPQYLLFYLRNNRLLQRKTVAALYWTVLSFTRSLIWFGSSFFWWFLLIYPISTGEYFYLILAITSFLNYSAISWVTMIYFLNRNSHLVTNSQKLKIGLKDLVAVFPVYLTHSYGPVLSVKDTFFTALFKVKLDKKKTER